MYVCGCMGIGWATSEKKDIIKIAYHLVFRASVLFFVDVAFVVNNKNDGINKLAKCLFAIVVAIVVAVVVASARTHFT